MYWFDCEIGEAPLTRPLAYLAGLLGDWDTCEREWSEALRAVESEGRRGLAARMRFELGDLFVRREHAPARARELIADARALATEVGLPELVALIDARHPRTATRSAPPEATRSFAMVLEGEYFAVEAASGTLRFKASRGMQYLARLVTRPGESTHVLELMGSSDADRGDAGETLDPQAFKAYRARLEALRETLEDAEDRGDNEGAERARDEMESIASELGRATGKGGRARKGDSSVDRARTAVQRRIKDALDRIAEQDEELGAWLRRAVRTGNFCSFRPDS
jgi:non-specific serine/threonine protein kinase